MDAATILLILVAAGQSGWNTGTTSAPPVPASSYDRYGPIPAAAPSNLAPPPSVMDRTQNAMNETGAALRDGFDAGMQSTSEQLSRGTQQMYDSARNATQQLGGQVQDWATGAMRPMQSAGSSARMNTTSAAQSTNPFVTASQPAATAAPTARNGSAPPPWPETARATTSTTTAPSWASESAGTLQPLRPVDPTASPGMTPVRTDSGWTSIGTTIAAPRLLIPSTSAVPMTNTTVLRTATNDPGPNFPGTTANSRQSVATAPPASPQQSQTPAKSSADDWASGWLNEASPSATSIARAPNSTTTAGKEQERSMLSVQQPAGRGTGDLAQGTAQGPTNSANKVNDPWAETDPWAKAGDTPSIGNTANKNAGPPPLNTANNQFADQARQQPAGQPGSLLDATAAAQTGLAGTGQNLNGAAPSGSTIITEQPKAPTGNQPPWMPLLVVSLSLAGSLGANFFLGWSYLDARQRYQSLVRKTADTFRRVKSAARSAE